MPYGTDTVESRAIALRSEPQKLAGIPGLRWEASGELAFEKRNSL